MTHISKNKLKKDELHILFDQFYETISKLDKKMSVGFIGDLLGQEEKIMLSKRLAAIAMFVEGNSSYRVWQLLKISPSTAERIRLKYELGLYKNIEKALRAKKKDYRNFWKALEIILGAGLPPRGRGRWKSVFDDLRS